MKKGLLAFFVLAVISSYANDQHKKHEIGLNLGWGNPSGNSIYYAQNVRGEQQWGIGIGLAAAGRKLGVDYKYLFRASEDLKPYLGLAWSNAGGSNAEISVNSDTATYHISGGNVLQPRVGLFYKISKLGLYLNAGYGFVLSGGGVEYRDGSTKENVETFAELLAIGGPEISISSTLFF